MCIYKIKILYISIQLIDRAYFSGHLGLGTRRPPCYSARLHRGQAHDPSSTLLEKPWNWAAGPPQHLKRAALLPRPVLTSRRAIPQKKRGPLPELGRLGSHQALSQAGRVPSAQIGQRVRMPRVRLRPRSEAAPRKEAREAAAPLRRFY